MNPSGSETTTTEPAPPAAAAAAIPDARRVDIDTFLTWWQLEYPAHNHGALNVPTYSTAGAVVAELLDHRTVAELQTLALALWAERDDAWIFASDRSVFVLKHRADYLDRRQRDAAGATGHHGGGYWRSAFTCEHVPSCVDYVAHTQRRRDEQIAAGGSE